MENNSSKGTVSIHFVSKRIDILLRKVLAYMVYLSNPHLKEVVKSFIDPIKPKLTFEEQIFLKYLYKILKVSSAEFPETGIFTPSPMKLRELITNIRASIIYVNKNMKKYGRFENICQEMGVRFILSLDITGKFINLYMKRFANTKSKVNIETRIFNLSANILKKYFEDQGFIKWIETDGWNIVYSEEEIKKKRQFVSDMINKRENPLNTDEILDKFLHDFFYETYNIMCSVDY